MGDIIEFADDDGDTPEVEEVVRLAYNVGLTVDVADAVMLELGDGELLEAIEDVAAGVAE